MRFACYAYRVNRLNFKCSKYLNVLFNSIAKQDYKIDRKLIIDSDSTDDTLEFAQMYGWEVMKINRKDFNHGTTRQKGIEYFCDIDIVIFITQDVIFVDSCGIRHLAEVFQNKQIGVSLMGVRFHTWGLRRLHHKQDCLITQIKVR